jgi:hypothetical protein
VIDGGIERLGRRLAARTTRRTFLDRAGKLAVLVAGGPALATLLTERAEARVCGQSGVSPKCPTFDCTYPDSVWGWCWYASPGCCAGGGLKKICDCCTRDWPNVHGYCPSGTNVRCIVESCATDPRVMHVPVQRAAGLTAAGVSMAASRLRPAGRGGAVVIGDADDALAAAVAAPVGTHLDAPVLLTGRGRLSSGVLAEVQRLAAERAVLVGPVPAAYADELRAYGLEVFHVGAAATLPAVSVAVARWLLERTGGRRAVCVETTGESARAAAAAGAHAALLGQPLLLGLTAARELTDDGTIAATLLVGPEAAGEAGSLAGGFPTRAATRAALSLELATLAATVHDRRSLAVHLVPEGNPDVGPGVAGAGGIVLHHPDGALGAARGWLIEHHPRVARAVVAGTVGALGDQGVHDLQAALHRFDTHRLQGVAGQGLPVISQPLPEREIGRARIAGAPEPDRGAYWASRANPRRR